MALNQADSDLLFGDMDDPQQSNPAALSITQGSYENPDEFAQDRQLSKDSGLPVDVVKHDRKEVKRQVDLDKLDMEGLFEGLPKLNKFLENSDNAKLSYDDIPHLGEIETNHSDRPWYEATLEGLTKGWGDSAMIGLGKLPSQIAIDSLQEADKRDRELNETSNLDERLRIPESVFEDRERLINKHKETLRTADQEIGRLTPQNLTVMEEGVRGIGTFLMDMAPGLAITAATGGKINPTMGYLTGKTFYDAAANATMAGKDQDEARSIGAQHAAIEYLTEIIPTKYAEKLFDGVAGESLSSNIKKFMIGDMGGEQLATFGQSMVDYGHDLDEQLANATSMGERFDIQFRRQAVTAISTLGGSSVISGTGYALGHEQRKDQAVTKAVQTRINSEESEAWLDRLVVLSQSSKLNERDGEIFAEYIDTLNPDDHVYLDAAIAGQIVDAPQYITDQLDGTGAGVSIPLAKFLTEIANNEETLALVRPHLKMLPELLSRQELDAKTDNLQVKKLMENAEKHKADLTEADMIFNQVQAELKATGRQGEHTSRQSSSLIPAYIVTTKAKLAERGIEVSVKDLFDEMKLSIVGPKGKKPAETETVLNQDEQTEYDRAVAKGLDMSKAARMNRAKDTGFIVKAYHSTSVDFNRFRKRRGDIGIHFGTAGQAEDRIALTGIGEGAQTIEVRLKIRKPLRLDDAGAWNIDGLDYQLKDKFPQDLEAIRRLKTEKDIREFIQSKGYDGVVYKNTGETQGASEYRDKIKVAKDELNKVFPKAKSSFNLEDQQVPEYIKYSELNKEYEKFREENAEDSYIAFESNQIRSVNAAFDPDHADSANILSQSDPTPTQKFGDQMLDDTGVDEAGNVMKLSEKAQTQWNHHQKRIKMVENLRACING